jgi:hypothetical protein
MISGRARLNAVLLLLPIYQKSSIVAPSVFFGVVPKLRVPLYQLALAWSENGGKNDQPITNRRWFRGPPRRRSYGRIGLQACQSQITTVTLRYRKSSASNNFNQLFANLEAPDSLS